MNDEHIIYYFALGGHQSSNHTYVIEIELDDEFGQRDFHLPLNIEINTSHIYGKS